MPWTHVAWTTSSTNTTTTPIIWSPDPTPWTTAITNVAYAAYAQMFVPPMPQLSDRQWHASRARAIDRAELLLTESLSPLQREELIRCGYFTVATALRDGHPRIYQLSRGRVGNIVEVNAQGQPVSRWCVHPRLDVPDADTLLAQKLWLENRPDELLAIANRHPV